jgi:hypothetical protein
MDYFLSDFPNAYQRALAFDEKITKAATSAISSSYASILSLTTRMVLAGTEVTVPTNLGSKKINGSDILTFVKDNGKTRYVSQPFLLISI